MKGGVTYRVVSDELGSVRMVLDAATGTVAQELAYDAWGRVLVDSNPGFQPFGYAGGLHDPLTGLVRFGARDYAAEVGRWTAKSSRHCLASRWPNTKRNCAGWSLPRETTCGIMPAMSCSPEGSGRRLYLTSGSC